MLERNTVFHLFYWLARSYVVVGRWCFSFVCHPFFVLFAWFPLYTLGVHWRALAFPFLPPFSLSIMFFCVLVKKRIKKDMEVLVHKWWTKIMNDFCLVFFCIDVFCICVHILSIYLLMWKRKKQKQCMLRKAENDWLSKKKESRKWLWCTEPSYKFSSVLVSFMPCFRPSFFFLCVYCGTLPSVSWPSSS